MAFSHKGAAVGWFIWLHLLFADMIFQLTYGLIPLSTPIGKAIGIYGYGCLASLTMLMALGGYLPAFFSAGRARLQERLASNGG